MILLLLWGFGKMSYAWDWFCPDCTSTLVGGMGEDDEQMEKEEKSYEGKAIHCLTCDKYYDFDTSKEVDPADYDPKDLVEGG